MGQRERKRRKTSVTAPGYERGRVKNEAIRAALPPLDPGERPTAVTVGAIVAAALGVANLALLAVGFEVDGKRPAAGGVIVFTSLMAVAAAGMWRARYWAVLGFEMLLGVTILIAAVSLTTASNWSAVALCLGIVIPSSWLFWKLIRAMARLQMPERPGAS